MFGGLRKLLKDSIKGLARKAEPEEKPLKKPAIGETEKAKRGFAERPLACYGKAGRKDGWRS